MAVETNNENSPTLGVVAISYNEERDLPGFIANLQFWVDEIVIVDDGSTDSTKALVEAANVKVNFIISPRKENEYFSHQRNKGIDARIIRCLMAGMHFAHTLHTLFSLRSHRSTHIIGLPWSYSFHG